METNRSLVWRGFLPATALALFASTSLGSGSGSCPDPVNYCLTSPNSVGTGAVISWTGTPSPAMDDFRLVATGCPANQFLVYFYGGGQAANPFGNGWRCVGNGGVGLFRFYGHLVPEPLELASATAAGVQKAPTEFNVALHGESYHVKVTGAGPKNQTLRHFYLWSTACLRKYWSKRLMKSSWMAAPKTPSKTRLPASAGAPPPKATSGQHALQYP